MKFGKAEALQRERVTLFLHIAQRLCHGQLARKLTRIQLGLECLNLGILGYRRLLHFAGNLRLGKLDCIALVLLGQFKPLIQLLLESAVANLLQDISVPRLVDFECFAAVGADDFVHVGASIL